MGQLKLSEFFNLNRRRLVDNLGNLKKVGGGPGLLNFFVFSGCPSSPPNSLSLATICGDPFS